jgi:hypothetical protein
MIISGVYSRMKIFSLFKGIPFGKVMKSVGIDESSETALIMHLDPMLKLYRKGNDFVLEEDPKIDDKFRDHLNPNKIAYRSSDSISNPTKDKAFEVVQERFPEITLVGQDIPIRETDSSSLPEGVKLSQISCFNRKDLSLILAVAKIYFDIFSTVKLSKEIIDKIEGRELKAESGSKLTFRVDNYAEIQPSIKILYNGSIIAEIPIGVEE